MFFLYRLINLLASSIYKTISLVRASLAKVFDVSALKCNGWLTVLILSIMPLLINEIIKFFNRALGYKNRSWII